MRLEDVETQSGMLTGDRLLATIQYNTKFIYIVGDGCFKEGYKTF